MEVSSALLAFLIFSIPAFIQNYAFQFFSRLRRPIEANIVASLAALLISAVGLHYIAIAFLSHAFSVFNPPDVLQIMKTNTESINNSSQLELRRSFNYMVAVSIVGFFTGIVVARFSLWGLWPFHLIGRLYYGGLYNVFKGVLGREIFISVLAKDSIDSRAIFYQGTLEDIKINDSGSIDYVTLVRPIKSIAKYNEQESMLRAGPQRVVGGDISGKFIAPRRMMIEGSDIANVFFEPQAPKQTFERWIFDKSIWVFQKVISRKVPQVILLMAGVISICWILSP